MQDRKYAVIDVETTGGGINGNRITEICIVLLQKNEVIDKFTSLVDPQAHIPAFITGLTGIDNDMVIGAPLFEDIAEKVKEMTEDAIFVAHNVNFDYNVIKGEYKRLGQLYTRKKLCTVRLSRKLIPNLNSYSLGNLCSSIGIPLNNRHRAEGDTDATVILFQRLLSLDPEMEVINGFLSVRSKEATLPPHLPAKTILEMPQTPGIYLFKDKKGTVIYVGKAINIKKRVLSHFYEKKNKEYLLGQETYQIDYVETGNELCALLLEAEQIQTYFPKYNRALKIPMHTYKIISYENRKGILQLGITKSKFINSATEVLYNQASAKDKLMALCEEFELCPRFCGLQSSMERCSHYRLTNCKGVCDGQEAIDDYNMRVQNALATMAQQTESFIISEKGRTEDELAFIQINQGVYQGYGFIEKSIGITKMEELENYLIPKQDSYFTSKIIQAYLKRTSKPTIIQPFAEEYTNS